MQIHSLTVSLLFLCFSLAFTQLSCLDRSGGQVPWFTLMKYPGNLTKIIPRYAYLDDNSGGAYEVINGTFADGKDEALARTIESINAMDKDHMNLYVYNDEYPASHTQNLSASLNAHAKGIIAYDNETRSGIYIMHSFPKYPSLTDLSGNIDFQLPPTTEIYGQNLYCVTLDKEILQQLLSYLPLEKPHSYFASGLFQNFHTDSKDNYTVTQFNLLNGDNQWLLTKNPKYDGFLYEDVISNYFQVPLAVESWGRPYQQNACPPQVAFSVLNIVRIAFSEEDSWDHYSDHSKWAITVDESKTQLACLCDMNRMESQSSRGGSCLCSDNKNLYKALTSVIGHTDPCQSSNVEIKLDHM